MYGKENEEEEAALWLLFLYISIVANNQRLHRQNNFLRRQSVVYPRLSPWNRLLNFGDDGSFLTILGMDRPTFMALESICFPPEQLQRRRMGRPPIIDERAQLGLILMFFSSTMHYKFLCLIFGILQGSASRYVHKMLVLLTRKLRRNAAARVIFPNAQELQQYAALVHNREPLVNNVVGFVDGVALKVECGEDDIAQSLDFNGYYHDTTCNNVFAFTPTGKICHAAINFPGSWPDSMVAWSLMEIAARELGDYAFCVDSGFSRTGAMYGKFVGPIPKKRRRRLAPQLRDTLLALHAVYISLRQASEWGMKALQGSFSRLKSRLPSHRHTRRSIIYSCVLLHNFRTQHSGLNQIATVFNVHYENYVNIEGYDKIARYFAL